MGHFAAAGEHLCKSLYMGGVTRRFPALRVALLEGGVANGCRLFADIIERCRCIQSDIGRKRRTEPVAGAARRSQR